MLREDIAVYVLLTVSVNLWFINESLNVSSISLLHCINIENTCISFTVMDNFIVNICINVYE